MRIAIAGPPGSGKTTVCGLVAQRMGYEAVLVGQLFRQLATERRVDLTVFGRMAEEDETIDRELDRRMVAIATTKQDVVLEGRLPGLLLKLQKVPVFAVYIDASELVRAKRIAGRERKPEEQVLNEIRMRERSERKRYKAYYGIDTADRSRYDLWLDSSEMTPERIADTIAAEARKSDA